MPTREWQFNIFDRRAACAARPIRAQLEGALMPGQKNFEKAVLVLKIWTDAERGQSLVARGSGAADVGGPRARRCGHDMP